CAHGATREVSESFRFIECSPWHLLLSEDLNLPSSTYNATSMPRGTSAATEFCFETTYRVPASEGRYIGNTREIRLLPSDEFSFTEHVSATLRPAEQLLRTTDRSPASEGHVNDLSAHDRKGRRATIRRSHKTQPFPRAREGIFLPSVRTFRT
ncbi:hypothetical protein EDD18DRAFT_1214256, partial [Armillaria luteobubalina]